MERKGYAVVRNVHPLFPQEVRSAVERRSAAILAEIQKQQIVSLPLTQFTVRAHAVGGQSPSTVIASTFGVTAQEVRIIVTDSRVAPDVLTKSFPRNDLLVVVEEREQFAINFLPSFSRKSCRILSAPSMTARVIEDTIVDITLGNYFRQFSPVKEIIAREGLESLFARKVRFARSTFGRNYRVRAAKHAGYVMLSSYSPAQNGDVAGRARDSFKSWVEFTNSLEYGAVFTGVGIRSDVRIVGNDVSALGELPSIGGQLPLAKLNRLFSNKDSGFYVLAVLRSAAVARKSPSLRHRIASIFGPRARINAVELYPRHRYAAEGSVLRDLSLSRHIAVINVEYVREDPGQEVGP